MVRPDSDAIVEAALRLPPKDRIDLADRLLASVEPKYRAAVEAAQVHECERRLQAYQQGKLDAIDGDEVMEKLRQGRRP